MDLRLYTIAGQREYYQKGIENTFEFLTANDVIIDYCIDLDCVSLKAQQNCIIVVKCVHAMYHRLDQ